MAFLSMRWIPLAILLYEQLIQITQITKRPQHTAFEQSAACLSVILFAILWHTG